MTQESVARPTLRRGPARRALLAGLGLLLLLALPGCATYRGSRLYVSGTRALEAGDPERAIRDLEAAAVLAPQGSEIFNHLGIAYAEVGRRDEALRAFDRALELDCDNAAAARNRADLIAASDPAGATIGVDTD